MRTTPLHLCALTISLGVAGCSSSGATNGDGAMEAGGTGGGSTAGQSAGGTANAVAGAGGITNTGGTSTGGSTGTAGSGAAGAGTSGAGGGAGTAGAGAGAAGAASGPDCSATMPTGGNAFMGTNVNGKADGLNYGIWTNGSGGNITVFNDAHAFSASWNNSMDFLAHVGLDFNAAKSYTAYGAILAQFVESKTGSSGGYSSIGIYGWMHNPCVEWYINEDSFTTLYPRGTAMATIDGAAYTLYTTMTTGTGGANACEAGHTGSWTQMISTRKTARQCGTVTVSDHFAAWAQQGWSLGTLSSVHINVEVGGGMGSIQFPVANVTTANN